MRKVLCVALSLVLSAAMVEAGGPPARGDRGGDRRGRGRMDRRGGMFDRMRGMFGRRERQTDIFEVARQSFDLTEELQAAIAKLDNEHAAKELEATNEVRRRLAKEYVLRIIEILPADQKGKYKDVMAALDARDDAIAAAKKELRAVLDKVKANQGADKVAPRRFFGRRPSADIPTSKMDVLRQCFVLSEEQGEQVRDMQRDNWGAMRDMMRERMGAMRRGEGRPDRAAMRGFRDTIAKAREEIDDRNAEAVVAILDDEQKKDFQTATAAMDACKKKEKEAEETCQKKVTELLGEEKARDLLGLPPKEAEPAVKPVKKADF